MVKVRFLFLGLFLFSFLGFVFRFVYILGFGWGKGLFLGYVCGLVCSIIVWLSVSPWLFRKTSIGDQFFITIRKGPKLYDICMLESFLMFYKSCFCKNSFCKIKNKKDMFLSKLDIMLNDLKQYPLDSEFYMETHQTVLFWLSQNNDQLMIVSKSKGKKRFFILRKLMILNITGPYFERKLFYRVIFKLKKGAVT